MYTGVLYQKFIRKYCRPIGYPIGPPSKLYEENQAIMKIVLEYRIKTQSRNLDVIITAIHEHHIRKIFDILDTISNMQISELNSKTHGGLSLR